MVLGGVRVLDTVGGIAGGYCTKLLADAGADVVATAGAPVDRGRRWPPGLFEFLHTSKRTAPPERSSLLVGAADIVVTGRGFDFAAASRVNPSQVVVTVTPFGLDGPWAQRPANEFTLQAACGSTGGRGLPDGTPLSAGGSLGEWITGTYAAVGALAAWLEAERTGIGNHVDVAMLDCMAIGMTTFPSVFAAFAAACGRDAGTAAMRKIEVPSIEPTADGWVTFTTNSAQQFSDFTLLIGHPELAEDDRYARVVPRLEHRDAFLDLVRAYTEPRTSAQVLEEAALLRIPVAPVLGGSAILEFEQFAERGVFVESPGGDFRQPRVPYRVSGIDPAPFRPVELVDQVEWPERGRQGTGTGAGRTLPLAGVRVVDFTAWWAGPCATHALACLGADVIKVESIARPDLIRFAASKGPGDPAWWEWGPLFHATNTNKRGVTIDLGQPQGRELALRLLSSADLMVENFTPRVLEQFELGWEVLQALNPTLCLVRMPAFGLDGPWRDRPGFAQTMESLSGLAAVTGWPDGPPVLVGGAGDPIAGLHGAFAAMLALGARRRTGTGHLVESTMVEAVLNVASASSIAAQLTGHDPERLGNAGRRGSLPQGVFACGGHDEWIAISAETDEQWTCMEEVLGRGDEDLRSGKRTTGRGEWLAERIRTWDAAELEGRLIAHGIPASRVIRPAEVAGNPQLVHRKLFEDEVHPITGRHQMPGLPFKLEGVQGWLRRASPLLGEHNAEVFAEIDISQRDLQGLRDLGIVGEQLGTA